MNIMINKVIENIAPHAKHNGIFTTFIEGLEVIRSDCLTEELHTLHEPAVCVVLQGKKRVIIGQEIFDYDSTKYLSISFDLPLTGQVLEASKEKPYLCLKLNIDTALLSKLVMEVENIKSVNPSQEPGLNVQNATEDLLDSLSRLTSLLNHPEDIEILALSIKREVFYRILSGPGGYHLKAQVLGVGKSKQIEKAIAWIKANFKKPFNTELAAREACLSVSTFHKYFKLITLMSPLQFQKTLRLQEARRLMMFEKMDAASAGGIVGYESPSQFNREYKRAFGASPKADVSRLINESTFN